MVARLTTLLYGFVYFDFDRYGLGSDPVQGGGTLATLLEKFRYFPNGRTHSVTDKLRQIAGARKRSTLSAGRQRDFPLTTEGFQNTFTS